jgi:hypothetical protein
MTLAFNAIARAKMMCERHDDHERTGRRATNRDDRIMTSAVCSPTRA